MTIMFREWEKEKKKVFQGVNGCALNCPIPY